MKLHYKIIISFVFIISLITVYYTNYLLFNHVTYYPINTIEDDNKLNISSDNKSGNIDIEKLLNNTVKCVKNKIIFVIRN